MSHSSIRGVVDLSDLKECEFNLDITTRFFLHLTLQLRHDTPRYWMHLVPLREYKLDHPPIWGHWALNFSSQPRDDPVNVHFFEEIEECDFWKFFHIEKQTYRSLVNHIRGLPDDDGYDYDGYEMFTQNVCILLCLWYLRHNESQLSESLELFNIQSLEDAEKMLEGGFEVLSKFLQRYIVFPTNSAKEVMRSRLRFKDNFLLGDVIGSIGHRIFKTEKDEMLFVQIVSNDQCLIVAINVSYERRLTVATTTSPFFSKLVLMNDLFLVASPEYACLPNMPFAVPIPDSDIEEADENMKFNFETYNILLGEIRKFVDASFMEVLARFPRLKNLHRSLPDAIITGFGLHNFCMRHKDIYPDILLYAKETFRPRRHPPRRHDPRKRKTLNRHRHKPNQQQTPNRCQTK